VTEHKDIPVSKGELVAIRPSVVSVSPPQSEMPAEGPNAGSYLHSLRRRWWLALLLGGLIGGSAGAYAWYENKPQFTASGSLHVAGDPPHLAFDQHDESIDFDLYRQTQIQLVTADYVMNTALSDRAIKELSLIRQLDDPSKWLKEHLSVGFPGNAEMMQVRLSGQDAEAVTLLVNAVIDAYLNEVVQADRSRRLERLNGLERVYNDALEKGRAMRADLKRLAESIGSGDAQALTLKQQMAIQHYAALRKEYIEIDFRLMQAKVEQAGIQAKLAQLEKTKDGSELSQVELEKRLSTDPVMVAQQTKVADLKQRVATVEEVSNDRRLVEKYRRDLKEAEKALEKLEVKQHDVIQRRLREEKQYAVALEAEQLNESIRLWTAQQKMLKEDMERMDSTANQIGQSSVDIEIMRSEIEQLDNVARRLGKEVETLRVELQSPSRVTLLHKATVPKSLDPSQQKQQVAVYGTAGFVLPMLLILWWDNRAGRVNSVSDMRQLRGTPVIGALPVLPARSRRRVQAQRAMRESVDGVRTLLLREAAQKRTQVIHVTSAVTGEGKTSLTVQLGLSFARAQLRTIVVDLDLRRPAVHLPLECPLSPGCSEVLRGELSVSDAICTTSEKNLWVIPAGKTSEAAIAALAHNGIGECIGALRAQFDVILLDSPPVLPVVDALLISQQSDATVLSVRRDVSQLPKLQDAHDRLAALGTRILGSVVTTTFHHNYGGGLYYGSFSDERSA